MARKKSISILADSVDLAEYYTKTTGVVLFNKVDYLKKFHPNLSLQALNAAIARGVVSTVYLGNTEYISMTDNTKEYRPQFYSKRVGVSSPENV
jgi:hypothetical protein